jgi:hypothetical protein
MTARHGLSAGTTIAIERAGRTHRGDDRALLPATSGRPVTLLACGSAMVDVRQLPDEFVGLPVAFLQVPAAPMAFVGCEWKAPA